jgi:hypothetical protein
LSASILFLFTVMTRERMEFLSRFDLISLMMTPSFWIAVFTVVIITILAYWLLNRLLRIVGKGVQSWGDKHHSTQKMRLVLNDMLVRTSKVLLFIAAFLFSLRFVELPTTLSATISHAWFLVLAIQMALWFDQGIISWLHQLRYEPGMQKSGDAGHHRLAATDAGLDRYAAVDSGECRGEHYRAGGKPRRRRYRHRPGGTDYPQRCLCLVVDWF